jgi:hypothetical protein
VTAQAIVQGDLVIPPNVTMECAHFITSALAKDPSKRPSIDQLLEHPYILAHIKAPAKKGRGLVVRAGGWAHERGREGGLLLAHAAQ